MAMIVTYEDDEGRVTVDDDELLERSERDANPFDYSDEPDEGEAA